MAKSYNFNIRATQADFSETSGIRFNTIVLGGSKSIYYDAPFTGTLAEVIAERDRVVAAMDRDCYVSVSMASRADRKPAGFDAKIKGVFKEAPKTTA